MSFRKRLLVLVVLASALLLTMSAQATQVCREERYWVVDEPARYECSIDGGCLYIEQQGHWETTLVCEEVRTEPVCQTEYVWVYDGHYELVGTEWVWVEAWHIESRLVCS